jgi:lysophospholipase L1-like esterase
MIPNENFPHRGHRGAQDRLALAALVLITLLSYSRLNADGAKQVWIASWASSQQVPEPQNALPEDELRDATVRQIFHLSAGGSMLRVHVSNAFGTEALHFTAVHVARPRSPASPEIDPASEKPLTFAGAMDVTVPPGAEYLSDPVEYTLTALSDLAVSFHLDLPPTRQSGHPGSRATSYVVHGDFVSAAKLVDPKRVDHWFQISGIDVVTGKRGASIVVLGDSITDGHGATTNGNDRWTDVLARRLQASPKTRDTGLSNQGIGGNHLLTDGLGPNALARFDRDVLAQAGVRWLIVFEGVNDLGRLARIDQGKEAEPPRDASAGQPPGLSLSHDTLVHDVIAVYQQIIARAHAHGIRVFGATITPYVGSDYYQPGPLSEVDRKAVNEWIRAPGRFDAVIDFDLAVRDPQQPDRLLPAYDCGDHLHPSPAGYRAMGESVPVNLFR